MKNRIAIVLASAAAALGILAVEATPASANATFGCAVTGKSLHATATRINYGPGSAIYVSATTSWKQVNSGRLDITYTFYRFTATGGLQTRYSNPTQWGNSSNMLDFNTEYVTVTWNAKNTFGDSLTPATCTVKVGV